MMMMMRIREQWLEECSIQVAALELLVDAQYNNIQALEGITLCWLSYEFVKQGIGIFNCAFACVFLLLTLQCGSYFQ